MDFDEYDYLEKMVENPDPLKVKETANGSEPGKAGERERSRGSKHRSDDKEDEDDDRRRSKRSKSRDDTRDRDRDRHRERGSSKHLSGSGEGERDRHRSSREGRDKDKGRDREERNGKDRDRERERDRGHGREREKGKESDVERVRRSESRVEREKSKDREPKEREKEIDFKDRDRRKKEDGTEPEADPERDQRTVFAYQICLKADERDVYEFFSRAGKVRDVRLIMDRNSRRSKGVGYIEFYDVMSVPMAIALSGQPLRNVPVMVKPSEAEKNLVQSTAGAAMGPGGGIGPYSGGARRLYVGNLHFNITEDQLRQVFEPFGAVELVQLPLDETGQCKGFGFVQFARLEDARNALNLNGQVEIAGRPIKVSSVTDQPGQEGGTTGDFDDDEGGGLALNARSRAMLMQKLDRTGTASRFTSVTSIAGSLGTPAVGMTLPGPPAGLPPAVGSLLPPGLPGSGLQLPVATLPSLDNVGVPSECLLLKNMFDPQSEMEEDFDLDIKEDVQEECSKHGALRHIFVDKNSMGFVYLRFENTHSAMGAQRALHGRWFAGKMITATYMVTKPPNFSPL
ncbi:RNA-binding protein 39 [Linum perenne]